MHRPRNWPTAMCMGLVDTHTMKKSQMVVEMVVDVIDLIGYI